MFSFVSPFCYYLKYLLLNFRNYENMKHSLIYRDSVMIVKKLQKEICKTWNKDLLLIFNISI